MAWQDDLQQASFNAISFFVKDANLTVGRRLQNNEYPLKEESFVRDLGRKSRTISFQAYVIGDDVKAQVQTLLGEFEKPEVGVLVHPSLGALEVYIESAALQQSSDKSRYAEFSISCIEAGFKKYPRQDINSSNALTAQANATSLLSSNIFASKFNLTGSNNYQIADTVAFASRQLTIINELYGNIKLFKTDPLTATEKLFSGEIGATATQLKRFSTALVDFKQNEADAALTTGQLLSAIAQLKTNPAKDANQQALKDMLIEQLIATTATITARRNFIIYDDAIELKNRLDSIIEQQLTTADPALFASLLNLKTAISNDLITRSSGLTKLFNYQLAGSLPAVVIAEELYDDALREQDIITRTATINPLFVANGNYKLPIG